MFRIKKDKPLEDLKDFGFYYNDNIGQYVYNFINSPLTVNVWNRKVNISDNNCLTNNILCTIIFDLTRLGYLEYIEEKENENKWKMKK